jgi:hypothetical protein
MRTFAFNETPPTIGEREYIMRGFYLWVATLFVLSRLIAPAFAADATAISLDSLLASGYEIKATNSVSAAATKDIWTGQDLPPQTIVTLQKANSIAICNIATVNWMNLNPSSFASTDRCLTR